MRPILTNLLITSFPSNSFPNSSTPPLNTPSSSPLLRPTSSPMTPITPLVLSDSTGNSGHYEKDFFSHEADYFFHNHHEELYTTSPYCYTEQYYNNNNCNTAIQPQVTVNINNPSPLSSGTTTNSFNTFNPQEVNNYANYAHNHQMMSSICNDYTAPPSHISPGMEFGHYNTYYNQQSYDGNGNANSPNSLYNTLENTYHNNYMQNQDAQLHEMITGLSKMDIIDSL
jgi:hypothetical protein